MSRSEARRWLERVWYRLLEDDARFDRRKNDPERLVNREARETIVRLLGKL
jgi:hypothetical protein